MTTKDTSSNADTVHLPINTHTTDKAIPLELMKNYGHNSESDFQKSDPKVYKIVKWFVNVTEKEQNDFINYLVSLDAEKKQEAKS